MKLPESIVRTKGQHRIGDYWPEYIRSVYEQSVKELAGYISPEEGGAKRAEKEACLTIEDVDKILAVYFCDDYNHQPYPKDPRDTRYEKWLRGMGGKLPEQLNERELDILLMKEEQRVVQDHGSIFFETLTYRCEELKLLKGQFVTVNYDPDHVLTLYIYTQATGDRSGEFIGCAHAINMDIQDSSLYEPMELLPERVAPEQIKPQTPKSLPPAPTPESNPTTPHFSKEEATITTEKNRIIFAKNQTLKRIW